MAFCGEVDNLIYLVIIHQPGDQRGVANIADNQFHAVKPGQIGRITGIGQRVQYRDVIARAGLAPVMHKIGANKAGTAGNHQIGHTAVLSFSSTMFIRCNQPSSLIRAIR